MPKKETHIDQEPSFDPAVLLQLHLQQLQLSLLRQHQQESEKLEEIQRRTLRKDNVNPHDTFEVMTSQRHLDAIGKYLKDIQSKLARYVGSSMTNFAIDLDYAPVSAVTEITRAEAQPLLDTVQRLLQPYGKVDDITQDLLSMIESQTSAATLGGKQMGRTTLLDSLTGIVPLTVNSETLSRSAQYKRFTNPGGLFLLPSKISGVSLQITTQTGEITREALIISRSQTPNQSGGTRRREFLT